ncbi:MAG: arylsulfatase [Bacteroidota bacterium]
MRTILFPLLLLIGTQWMACQSPAPDARPNVLLIMTDDQGYGDLSAHGNPWLKTPHLDQLHAESIRLTDFHVGTTCAPTRASLMTGKYCNRVGAWHTIQARHLPWPDEWMLAESFAEAGYVTGMFGKWHLGDNAPYRPQDRGFQQTLYHGGGGVGQTPDYWNNDYFDDTYFRNGQQEPQQGYCTDVWFSAATDFIRTHQEQPFFCYLATNAPHSPYYVDTSYVAPYQQEEIVSPEFYGMIANIDENVGKLRQTLTELGLTDNTLLVYLTDNGTSAGVRLGQAGHAEQGFNAGMRGKKGSPYEGGHRVPCFLYWKDGQLTGGKDLAALTGVFDLAPTLLDLCGIPLPESLDLDGISLAPALQGADEVPDRILFADTQREDQLEKFKRFSIMQGSWRLVNGELYDLSGDPGQLYDLADAYPQKLVEFRAAYEVWWERVSERSDEYSRVPFGTEPQTLTQHDIHLNGQHPAWHQSHVRAGKMVPGFWAVEVPEAGRFEIELRRYPVESGLEIQASAPEGDVIPQGLAFQAGTAQSFQQARLLIGEQVLSAPIEAGAKAVGFEVELEAGPYRLEAELIDEAGEVTSAYYVYARKITDSPISLSQKAHDLREGQSQEWALHFGQQLRDRLNVAFHTDHNDMCACHRVPSQKPFYDELGPFVEFLFR